MRPLPKWALAVSVYRKGDWKLIYYYNPSRDGQPYVKLFRLDEDPFERDDLSDRCPDKVRVLFHEMKKRLEVEGGELSGGGEGLGAEGALLGGGGGGGGWA